jgi:hypothetical protein
MIVLIIAAAYAQISVVRTSSETGNCLSHYSNFDPQRTFAVIPPQTPFVDFEKYDCDGYYNISYNRLRFC